MQDLVGSIFRKVSFKHFSTHGCCGWKGKHIDKGALATCMPFLVPAICTLAQPTCWRAEKLKPLANPLDMFGLLNLQRLQVCKHMPRPLRKELELDLSQAGFRTLPNFTFPEWQFSKSLAILRFFHDFYFAWEESSGFLTEKLWGWNLFGRCISRSCHEASTRDMAKRSGSAAPNVVSGILDDLGNRRRITIRWTYMKPGYSYMW